MKQKLREKFLTIRRNNYFKLSEKNKKFFLENIKNICLKNNIKKLGFYYPINYEVNLIPVVLKIRIKDLKIFLPVVEKENKMNFKLWKTYEPFCVNRFGILEPNRKNKKGKPQMILVPLLAYDKNKNRLGYGRGFYDRFLNKISNKKNIISVGVAYSFQQAKTIPSERHDKKLDYILTEKSIIY